VVHGTDKNLVASLPAVVAIVPVVAALPATLALSLTLTLTLTLVLSVLRLVTEAAPLAPPGFPAWLLIVGLVKCIIHFRFTC
jgi:hypothetical protein